MNFSNSSIDVIVYRGGETEIWRLILLNFLRNLSFNFLRFSLTIHCSQASRLHCLPTECSKIPMFATHKLMVALRLDSVITSFSFLQPFYPSSPPHKWSVKNTQLQFIRLEREGRAIPCILRGIVWKFSQCALHQLVGWPRLDCVITVCPTPPHLKPMLYRAYAPLSAPVFISKTGYVTAANFFPRITKPGPSKLGCVCGGVSS